MKQISLYMKNRSPWSWLTAGLVVLFFFLTFRNAGLYPVVLSDEWTYSQFSRLIPLHDVGAPSYLYFFLFRSSNACGDGFLECARILNVLCFLASAPFIFLIAKRVASNGVSLLLALASVAGPINVYTAWFMPESMYYLGFWLASWLALRAYESPSFRSSAQLGAALGLLALVKVHAIFLLPGISLFIVYSVLSQSSPAVSVSSIRRAFLYVAIFFVSAAIVRFGIAFIAAGSQGLSLYGKVYENMQKYSDSMRRPLTELIALGLFNLRGHAMALAILYNVPLVSLGVMIFSPRTYKSGSNIRSALAVYSAIIILTLLAVTVMFTASVSGNGPYETNVRLHMRYYDFSLPLLMLGLASQLGLKDDNTKLKGRFAAAAILISILLCSAVFLLAMFKPSYVDGPEIDVLASHSKIIYIFIAMAFANVLVWVWKRNIGTQLFLFAFLPIYTATAMIVDMQKVRAADTADVFVRAGIFAHQYLTDSEKNHLTIVGSDSAGLFKAQFYVDNVNVKLMPQSASTPIDAKTLNDPDGWLLVIGDAPLPEDALVHVGHREFSLVQLHPPKVSEFDFDFSKKILNNYLKNVEGLSVAESSGRWSNQKTLRFDFSRDLPQALTLTMSIQGFGPNIGQPLKVIVGKEERSLVLSENIQDVTLQFENGADARSISMEIPHPASPKELGLGDDGRQLGAMLNRMRIGGIGVTGASIKNMLGKEIK